MNSWDLELGREEEEAYMNVGTYVCTYVCIAKAARNILSGILKG